jgi:hypothetical protein
MKLGNWAFNSVVIGVQFLLAATVASAAVQLHPNHPASRCDGIDNIRLTGGVLTLEAKRPTTARLVLTCDQFLDVGATSNAAATLRRDWDQTLKSYCYVLEFTVSTPGAAKIELQSLKSPKAPFSTTPAEMAAFQEAFRQRSSRFPDNPSDFRRWQQSYRDKLARWLMGGGLPARTPLDARRIETSEFPAFTLRRVEYRTQKDRTNILLVSLPKGANKVPVLLALHGHENAWGQAAANAYRSGEPDDFCAYFAERGWAVVQPATMNHTLQHQNWTLQGEWTWDAIVALDYAATLPEVDMGRVAVCGLSTGGHLAMNVLALDDRVKAGVVGCVLSTWNHYYRRCRIPPHCDCGIAKQLGSNLEQCDWAVLAAPKPVQFQQGRRDACFCPDADPKLLNLEWNIAVMPAAEYETMFAEVRRAFALVGKPADVATTFHNGPHRVDSEAAFHWLNQRLNAVPTR